MSRVPTPSPKQSSLCSHCLPRACQQRRLKLQSRRRRAGKSQQLIELLFEATPCLLDLASVDSERRMGHEFQYTRSFTLCSKLLQLVNGLSQQRRDQTPRSNLTRANLRFRLASTIGQNLTVVGKKTGPSCVQLPMTCEQGSNCAGYAGCNGVRCQSIAVRPQRSESARLGADEAEGTSSPAGQAHRGRRARG